MLIEVNVEDCYGLAQQSADASNLPESAASGEIWAETWENWFSVWLEHQAADVPEAPGYEVSLRLTADTEM
ncbi:rRNA maturation RNase YbeY, partial [Microcoleus sp. HI-ES]|nr:rRNA maturation RNase YbeY [Microcoleus sp. HI-ES]